MTGNLIAVLLWVLALAGAPAEKYYVTFIKGKVLLQKTHSPLKVGDALNPEDKLVYADKNAKVSFISPGKGRFNLNADAGKEDTKGELLAVLKSSLVPAPATYHLSTRALLFEGYDPATYFSSESTQGRILLIKSEPLLIIPSYKLDAGNFFFVQFNAGGRTITRKVEQTEKGIIFSENLFMTGSGEMADKVSLCYQTNSTGQARSTVIAAFTPVLVEKQEISDQLRIITDMVGIGDKKKLKAELSSHVFENYGKIGADELSRLFGI